MRRKLLARLAGLVFSGLLACSTSWSAEVDLSKPPVLSFSQVKELIEKYDIKSVDELLPKLPEEYRKYYTFMYRTRSLQAATPSQPRTIVYGPDARLMMAFSGKPDDPFYNTLETIEYDSKTNKYEFRSINFPKDGKSAVTYEGQDRCVKCHRDPPRPNWDPYNNWSGAYGSRSRNYIDRIAKGSPEAKNYIQFMKGERNKGRYKFLPKQGRNSKAEDYARKHGEIVVKSGASLEPNGLLTEQLYEIQAQKILKDLEKSSEFSKYKYALAYTYLCWANVSAADDPITRLLSGSDTARQLKEFRSEISKQGQQEYTARTGPVLVDNPPTSQSDAGLDNQIAFPIQPVELGPGV